jgi:hypothetical protein
MTILRSLAVCCALLLVARASQAHHSFSMYDSEKLLHLEGTIKEFQWTNPHAILWVNGSAEPGKPPELWTVELPTSPGNLTRMGWKRTSLSPGDKVIVELNPLRDGRRGGSFKKATITTTGVVLVANVRDEPPSGGGAGGALTDKDHDDHDHDEGDHGGEKSSCALPPFSAASAPTGAALLALVASAGVGRRRRRAPGR